MKTKLIIPMSAAVLLLVAFAQVIAATKLAPDVKPSQVAPPPGLLRGGTLGTPPEQSGPLEAPTYFHAGGPMEPSSTTLNLTWKDNSTNESSFRICRKIVTNTSYPITPIAVLPPNTAKYHDTGLEPETTYSYILAAFNSTNSSFAVETTATTNPRPPEDLKAQAVSGKKVKLTWKNKSNTAELIMIERSAGTPGAFQKIFQKEPISLSSYVDEGLTPKTKYFYRLVVLKLPFNASDYTPNVSVVTPAQ
ncbi:MAG: hypothetical protein ACYC99_07045 [Candidatus Geothermincolia bacterium]